MKIKNILQSHNQKRGKIGDLTVITVWVRAGGRCEFKGWNEYLLIDSLTQEEANFSDRAHIIAVKKRWARGENPLPSEKINDIGNLMLLCKKHHMLIDDGRLREKYPISLLLTYKKEHEDRIFRLTAIQEGNKTFVIRLKAKIDGESVAIPNIH